MKIGDMTGTGCPFLTYECNDLPLPNNLIGVEIEVERTNNRVEVLSDLNRTIWQGVRDGSLRNNGMEFIFRKPVFGKDVEIQLKEFEKLVEDQRNKHPGSFQFTHRTSVHIHVDVRNMEPSQVFWFLYVYVIFERTLFRYLKERSGEDRSQSPFCVAYYASPRGFVSSISDLLNGSPRLANLKRSRNKYSAVNFSTMWQFGTLEFRQMFGTHSTEEIMRWISIILEMKKFAETVDEPPENALLRISGQGPQRFLEEVFPVNWSWLVTNDLEEDVFDGVRDAQDMAMYIKAEQVYGAFYRKINSNINEFVGNFSNQLRK